MEDANGSFKGSEKPMNGHATSMNGHATKSRRKPTPKQGPGFLSWSFSILARLLTWYSILTLLFRCPATSDQCTESSPRICKPYFQLKETVSPHVEPYYDAYAAPYVELARPYYETVDQRVLTPTWAYATKYGGPRIAQAQALSQAQWEKNVQPELIKYQALAKAKYDQTLAPHVDQASSAIAPYYEIARTNALQTYHDLLLPSYVVVQPYVQQGYTTASTFTTETAIPSLSWAWNKTNLFLDGTVWPQLHFIYAENVEPQLLKIGQRLGRYNASNTQKVSETVASTAAAKAASTVTKPTSLVSSAATTPASSDAATSSSEPSPSNAAPSSSAESEDTPAHPDSLTAKIKEGEVVAPEASPGESDVRQIARETVTQDLKDWQEKYVKAADEGAAEIDDRLDEISQRMITRQAKTMGKSLVKHLQDSIESELKTLKADIKSIIGQVKADFETPESALEQIAAAVRRAGLEIKEKSQDVRNWSENYEKELQATVVKAAENHFMILNNIRDLALQKIGMKWAWMDGVTYKDWAKYHLLKERFDEWEGDLKNLITAHPGLQEAEDAGRAIEGDAMSLAQTAVKELASLRLIAGWKLTAQDDSDDFDPESTRLAAEEVSKASAAEAEESKAAAAESAAGETTLSEGAPTASVEGASASVAPNQEAGKASDTPDLASTIVLEETPVFVDNTTEATESSEPSEPGTADLPVDENPESIEEDISSVDEPENSEPTMSVKSAFMGAAAQSVPSRQPILDDDDFEAVGSIISAMQSDVPATISSAASSAYSAAMSGAAERYSQALSLVSAQISGTPKPAHEQLLASVTSAYGNAVGAASSRLDAALSAASGGIFATTTTNALPTLPTFANWAHVESMAAQRLNEGQSWAAEQYESAKVAIGLATPTPSDISGTVSSVASVVTAAAGDNVEKLLQNAQHNYYAGLGLAQARYSEFMAAASSALSSVTATPTPTDIAGTLSSVASVASESAAAAAAVAGENASSVAAAGYENVASAAGAAGTFAVESWNVVLDQISAQVYGQPTPTAWYDKLFNTAGEYAASATEAVGGGSEAVTSAAGSYASAASEEVSKQYVAVSSIVSELLVGKEPTLSESVYSRLAEAYAVAASSAGSFATAASATVASIATDATEAVKEATQNVKDEL